MNWKEQMIAEWILKNTYWEQRRYWWFTKSSATGKSIPPLQKVWVRILRLPGWWQEDATQEILRVTEFEKRQLRGDIPDWQRVIK